MRKLNRTVQSGDDIAGGTGMKVFAVALDYDGTIATNDVLCPEVRTAIVELRAQNIILRHAGETTWRQAPLPVPVHRSQ